MKRIRNYKEVFEVEGPLVLKELKTKYRNLVKEWHPDKFQDEAKKEEAGIKSSEIIDAYHFLVSIAPETKEANLEEYNTMLTDSKIADFKHEKNVFEVTFTDGTIYEYFGVSLGNTYDFYVTAVENGGVGPLKSTSNVDSADISSFLIAPTFNYLYNATVVDLNQVDIQFFIDTIADVTGYNVMRSTNENGPFTTIGTVNKVLGMDTIVDYSDTTGLNTDTTSYFYQIEIVNETCGFDSNFSNLGSTILIDVTSSPVDAKNTITITEYKDWDLGVLRYDVYRALGGVWGVSPIRSLLAFSDATTIVDDVSGVFDGNGEFCYRVEAVSKGGAPTVSTSNESCALHDPLLYVPNAFSPSSSFNSEFKPVLTFAEPSSYTFRVFDRWGQVVFETGDVTKGWNGSYDNSGKLAATGVYFYVIEFNSASGDDFVKRGTVTIVY